MVTDTGHVTMLYGAGGTVIHSSIEEYVVKYFGGRGAEVPLEAMGGAAVIVDAALKSDSHVVNDFVSTVVASTASSFGNCE